MKTTTIGLLAATLMAIAPRAHALDQIEAGNTCDAAFAALPHGTILDLLDPQAPADRRAAALVAYQRLAQMKECPEFGYTLGQLYRHGEYLPGNPLPQDVAKARELILPMAESGYLPAYADLAEMEMRHANTREAMKWTQVYLYFVDHVFVAGTKDADAAQYERSAYNANLLGRVEFLWNHVPPSLPQRLVNEDLNAYLHDHGDDVERRMRERQSGLHLRASAQDSLLPYTISGSTNSWYHNLLDDLSAASASWIVEVMPSGQIGRVVLENFVPNEAVTRQMKSVLARYKFAPLDEQLSKTVRISVVVGNTESRELNRRRR